jgi:hypothetical protein
MTLRFPQERHELLQTARVRQQTEDFKNVYHGRAGIEGTFSKVTRNTGCGGLVILVSKKHISSIFFQR